MTVACAATLKIFRHGLRGSSSGRAFYETLYSALGRSKLPLKQVKNEYGFPQHVFQRPFSWCPAISARNSHAQTKWPIQQSRYASSSKPAAEEKVSAGVPVENELSLSPAEIRKVFGRGVDPEEGVEILMALQQHRSEGTLDLEMPYSNDLIAKGLSYLRSVNPIDEDAAILARVDRELDSLPQTLAERPSQAVSQFQRLREENKAKRKLREAEQEAEEQNKIKEGSHTKAQEVNVKQKTNSAPSRNLVELRPEPQWVHRYREKATNKDSGVLNMSNWARLLPSAAVTITVVALSLLFAQNYTPPSRNARFWPDIPPAAAALLTIIGVNCAVYVMWRTPQLWRFMNRNFLVVPGYPYSMSMIGAAFSHQTFAHLFANVAGLWFVGVRGKYLPLHPLYGTILRYS